VCLNGTPSTYNKVKLMTNITHAHHPLVLANFDQNMTLLQKGMIALSSVFSFFSKIL
jgi:hypothetical protein